MNQETIFKSIVEHLKSVIDSDYPNDKKAGEYRKVMEHAFQDLLGLENTYFKKHEYLSAINNSPILFDKKITTKFNLLFDYFSKWNHYIKDSNLSIDELDKHEQKLIQLIEIAFNSKLDIDENIKNEVFKVKIIQNIPKKDFINDFPQANKLEPKKSSVEDSVKGEINYQPNIGDYLSIYINSFKETFKEIEKENADNPLKLRRDKILGINRNKSK
ncbi:hypothetical protein [Lutibacter sp.]|uniref:hypothetical protein n=1 Tax=Lutibacter sp. TaxID=1925666 RepID=UPI0035620E46